MAFAGAQNEDHESDDEGPDELARTDTMEREANMAEAKAKALAASGGASAMGRHDASSPTKAASKLVCVATGTAAPCLRQSLMHCCADNNFDALRSPGSNKLGQE